MSIRVQAAKIENPMSIVPNFAIMKSGLRMSFRVWRSWIARVPWAHKVVSSNLTTLTNYRRPVLSLS
jgi:hypothetical protein